MVTMAAYGLFGRGRALFGVHALIEKNFYPRLLKRASADAEGETLDAIGDHNDIRDGVRGADAAGVTATDR